VQTATKPLHKLATERLRREARESFKEFIQATYPEYRFGKFNELLCLKLEEFLDDVLAGKHPRLMILAPPRSGKSELATRRFPAWVAGKHPWMNFIACSYGADLAEDMSSDCKDIVKDDDYRRVFPEMQPPRHGSGIKGVSKMWHFCDKTGTKRSGGYYRAAGVGGSITGRGFHIGIIDDPVKDYAEASSPTIQQRNWDWYNTTFFTRQDPLINGVILIMTRWHKQDLGGKLLDRAARDPNAEQWDVFSFPMVAEKVERYTIKGKNYKLRVPGEILFPERMPQSFVDKCKAEGGIKWTALYQQSPTIEGGNYFKRKYWNWYKPAFVWDATDKRFVMDIDGEGVPRFTQMIITGDTAQKTGEEHDFSVFACWGVFQGRIYLIDLIRGKWEPHEMKRHVRRFWKRWGTFGRQGVGPQLRAKAMYIEDKVSGTGLIQDLRIETFDSSTGEPVQPIPCIPIGRAGSGSGKRERAIDCQPFIEAGGMFLPEDAPFTSDFLIEFEDFTLDDTHEHDDQVDVTLDVISIKTHNPGGGINYDAPWGNLLQ